LIVAAARAQGRGTHVAAILALVICALALSCTWAEGADASSLSVSDHRDRSNAVTLGGQAYERSAAIYVFLAPEPNVARVSFYLDDPQRLGAARHVESYAPYDFVNTDNDGLAAAFAVGSVSDGSHTITAQVLGTDGRVVIVSGTFNVLAPASPAAVGLSVSDRPDRSGAVTLGGQAYDRSAVIYVFAQVTQLVTSVRFYLDDPQRLGTPRHVELSAPFDFVTTNLDGSAAGYPVGLLPAGDHSITAEAITTDGTAVVATGTFTVQSTVVFEDDFDGTTLDTTNWLAFYCGGNGGNGLRRPSAVSVSGGNLVLTAQTVDGQLVSGALAQLHDYTYARYEFRVKTEVDQTGTMSGVVMTWPRYQWSPEYTENDIYETGPQVGTRWPFRSFVHYGLLNRQQEFIHQADASQWHTMVMDWRPASLRIYRDGTLVWTITDPAVIPDVAHHLAIQLDAFANRKLTVPVRMYVDYVRITR
jgi:hypothetical protein